MNNGRPSQQSKIPVPSSASLQQQKNRTKAKTTYNQVQPLQNKLAVAANGPQQKKESCNDLPKLGIQEQHPAAPQTVKQQHLKAPSDVVKVDSKIPHISEKGKLAFQSPRIGGPNEKTHGVEPIYEEVKSENVEAVKDERISVISSASVLVSESTDKRDLPSKTIPQRSDIKKLSAQQYFSNKVQPTSGIKQPSKVANSGNVLRNYQPPQVNPSSAPAANQTINTTTTTTSQNTTANIKQQELKHESQSSLSIQKKTNEEDLADDIMDSSIDIQETNTLYATRDKVAGHHQSKDLTAAGSTNNKIYQSTPSKLNTKFQAIASKPGAAAVTATSTVTAASGPQVKHQNLKPSAIQQKKLIVTANMQESGSKPLAQLDLNLAATSLTQVPIEQVKNSNLRSIDLKQNRIVEVPDELFFLPHLWKLQLDNNQIAILPDKFEGLTELRYLTLNSNLLEFLPPSLFSLTALEKLDISQNKITHIPNEIGDLTNLKSFLMVDLCVTELPCSLHKLSNLQTIGIDWFLYLKSVQNEKIVNKLQQAKVDPVAGVLKVFETASQTEGERVSFFRYISLSYNVENFKQLLNKVYVSKRSTIIHAICQHNHQFLFDLLSKEQRQVIDMNAKNELGYTPLMLALNSESSSIVDKILREFKDHLQFAQAVSPHGSSSSSQMIKEEDSAPLKQEVVIHPMMIAVKQGQYETALRILQIMLKQHQKQKTILDLNLKDENQNTLLHHLFSSFSANMELSVELCQELLKQSERGRKNIPCTVVLKLNEINKFGLSPIDVSIETKQNQALEFAIYFNKNILPQFKADKYRQKFDLNFNKGPKGYTPLHRAILIQNYKAIYLLLSSGECNLFAKDSDYKSAREYCYKVMFLAKYLRKSENNFIRKLLSQSNSCNNNSKVHNQSRATQMLKEEEAKPLAHNNLNFFIMQKRANRVKYNSWYQKFEHKNMLSNSQQPTLEQRDPEEDEQAIKVEDLEDDDDDQSDIIMGSEQKQKPEIQMSLVNSATLAQDSELQLKKQQLAHSILKQHQPGANQLQLDVRRASDANKKNSKTISRQQNQSLIAQTTPVQHSKSKLLGLTDNTLSGSQPQDKSYLGQKPLAPQSKILTITASGDFSKSSFEKVLPASFAQQFQTPVHQMKDDFHTADEEFALEESPDAALPCNHFQYVLPVNNSKLSRKPYYKQLQQNRYEREFCILMDSRLPSNSKLSQLYKVFADIQQDPEKKMAEGRDFFAFLKLELEEKDSEILPFRNEISYFSEFLVNASIQRQTSLTNKKSTHYSLEKGPLPMIKEYSGDSNELLKAAVSKKQKKTVAPKVSGKNIALSAATNVQHRVHTQVSSHSLVGDEDKVTLRSNSSSKTLDVPSLKGSNSGVNKRGESQNKQVNLKVTPIAYEPNVTTESQKSPSSPKPAFNESSHSSHQQSQHHQAPSHPQKQGNQLSFQKQLNDSKSNHSSTLQSPVQAAGNHIHFTGPQFKQKTDSCIKKIEVQISDPHLVASNSGERNISVEALRSSCELNPPGKLEKGKVKQLTINPTASNQVSASGIGKGASRIGSGAGNNKLSTPQNQKGAPTTSQLITLQNVIQNTTVQTAGGQQANATTGGGGAKVTIVHATVQKTSSSLSNRSNSNPRHSILGGGGGGPKALGKPAATQQEQLQTQSKIPAPSKIPALSKNSSNQNPPQTGQITVAQVTVSVTSNPQPSKLKAPSKPSTASSGSSAISRHTIGTKPSTKR